MAVYPGEFIRNSVVKFALPSENPYSFSLLITEQSEDDALIKSFVVAAKPLFYLASICGLQMFQYSKDKVQKLSSYRRVYSALLVSLLLVLVINIKPVSWNDTRVDVPLNILTKLFGYLHNLEIICCVLITSFRNSKNNVEFIATINNVDSHFKLSKNSFSKVRLLSVFLVLMPLCELVCTFFLRKFLIINLPVHLTFFIISVHGSIIVFLIILLYVKQLMLNSLLERKMAATIGRQENTFCKTDSYVREKLKDIFKIVNKCKVETPCWLELMQIYDKISDCYFLFNKMYAVQVLFMFLTWLLVTLLIICRSLSPSLNYSELFLSDLFLYTCINSRPFFLAVMCELIVKERAKTLNTLLRVLVYGDLDEAYQSQVQTMLELVETRKLEISANIFPVNIPNTVQFAGRAISYVVLMIQYFYNHVLES